MRCCIVCHDCVQQTVGVSSVLGHGIDEFFKKIDTCTLEYVKEYLPHLEKLKKQKEEAELARYGLYVVHHRKVH